MSTLKSTMLGSSRKFSSHVAASFSHPATSFSHPTASFSHPTTSFSHPTTSFSHPATSFSHPAPSESSAHMADEDVSWSTDASHASTSKPKTNKRKRTRNLKLIRLPPDEKLDVYFNKFSQAIGPDATTFANHLGCIVRNCEDAPIDVENWDKIPDGKKLKMMEHALEKFRFDLNEPRAFWISQKMRKSYNCARNKLKRLYCDTCEEIEDMIKNRPKHVPEDQWRGFVDLVNSKEYKDKCKRNKTNRSKQVMSKNTGSKSFARLRHEKTIELGQEPNDYQFWKFTHVAKDGKGMVDVASQSVFDQVEAIKMQTTSVDSTTPVEEIESNAFSTIMGPERHGRVRLYGLGPTPTTVYGGVPTRSELISKLDDATKRNEALQVKLNGIELQMEQEMRKSEEDKKKNEEKIAFLMTELKKEKKRNEAERKRNEEERKKSDEERRKSDAERKQILDFISNMGGLKVQSEG